MEGKDNKVFFLYFTNLLIYSMFCWGVPFGMFSEQIFISAGRQEISLYI
jgi:hypothetical protein